MITIEAAKMEDNLPWILKDEVCVRYHFKLITTIAPDSQK